jgi:hypothetical protein
MEITEAGYYWYRNNGSSNQELVMIDKDKYEGTFRIWFFGSEIDMTLPVALKRGEFLKKVEDYAD